MEARNTEIAFEWTSDPTKADTDDDGANDKKERTDVGDDSNDLPSNVKAPDVIHVFPATDESFRNRFPRDGFGDHKEYVRHVIDSTNEALKDEFASQRPTPHLVITKNDQGDWGEWDNPDGPNEVMALDDDPSTFFRVPADTPATEARQMRKHLEWPVRDGGVDRRGADVLSGFTGQPIGADPGSAPFREYIDARSGTAEGEDFPGPLQEDGTFDDEVELTGGITMMGTKDPNIATNPETVPNIYMHELGHVLGAIHPNSTSKDNYFEVPRGTTGVMCKTSCVSSSLLPFGDEGDILTAEFFSSENKDRILRLDYDYKDADDPLNDLRDNNEGPSDDTLTGSNTLNEPRNIGTVSTAASTEPPDENVDIEP